MSAVAEKYPTFIVPIRRARDDVSAPSTKGENDTACEFYFLQWDFHDAPPIPTADSSAKVPTPGGENPNPKISTIMFTPLEEYKLRHTFATPYLVLTNYTDLASTHNQVLLRGEITPRSNSDKYMLSQEDAQQLSMAVQKFYLWGDGDGEGERLVRIFHEKPSEFKWEDLLRMADWDV
jgi:ATP synthase F1 complex assembly factor 1